MDQNRYEFEASYDEPDDDQSQADGQQVNLSMKDQEQMMQELKKENFDLKLRLYMTQKNGESAEGKASEYEQQLGALLEKLEEQQRVAEAQARELQEMRTREKSLIVKHKRLEQVNQEQDEKIHQLSLNLSKLHSSMSAVNTSVAHSTPIRQSQSTYITTDYDSNDEEFGIRPLGPGQPNISAVPPMRREVSVNADDTGLLKNDRGIHYSVTDDHAHAVVSPITKNYYNNAIDSTNGNVGVVRPNNSRTVVDLEIPDYPNEKNAVQKKKKKGVMKIFGLCTGKSGQTPARKDSMYHKKEPAKITVTQLND